MTQKVHEGGEKNPTQADPINLNPLKGERRVRPGELRLRAGTRARPGELRVRLKAGTRGSRESRDDRSVGQKDKLNWKGRTLKRESKKVQKAPHRDSETHNPWIYCDIVT